MNEISTIADQEKISVLDEMQLYADELLPEIVRDRQTAKWLQANIVDPCIQSEATVQQKRALLEHWKNLCTHEDSGDIKMAKAWQFKNGALNERGWAVLSRTERPRVVAQVEYFFRNNLPPTAILRCIQGVGKGELDLGDMDERVIRSMKPLYETDWKLLLRLDPQQDTRAFHIIRKKYYEHLPSQSPKIDWKGVTYHQINTNKKRVQELFDIKK